MLLLLFSRVLLLLDLSTIPTTAIDIALCCFGLPFGFCYPPKGSSEKQLEHLRHTRSRDDRFAHIIFIFFSSPPTAAGALPRQQRLVVRGSARVGARRKKNRWKNRRRRSREEREYEHEEQCEACVLAGRRGRHGQVRGERAAAEDCWHPRTHQGVALLSPRQRRGQ